MGVSVVQLTEKDLAELFEVREALEGMACRFAAERNHGRRVGGRAIKPLEPRGSRRGGQDAPRVQGLVLMAGTTGLTSTQLWSPPPRAREDVRSSRLSREVLRARAPKSAFLL